jgi:hypothetical protein
MMMWCKYCKQAVSPYEKKTYEIPDADVGGHETIVTYHCPDCNHEVYQEPGECVMCGEPVAPDKALCEACIEDIGAMITLLAEYRKIEIEAVKDGLTEYLNMEE